MSGKEKMVYLFKEGNAGMRLLLGGKGANLAEMTNNGIPVPPGFTITTNACKTFIKAGEKFSPGLWEQVTEAMSALEEQTGKGFGDKDNPLLVSVRSGAPVSMPGMMDTVLNLGLNEETLKGLIKQTNDERFAWDSYRRFVSMFGDVVLGVPKEDFETALEKKKHEMNVELDTELDANSLKVITTVFKKIITGAELFSYINIQYYPGG